METRRQLLVAELRQAVDNYGRFDTRCANITAAHAAISETELDLTSRLADAVGRYRIAQQRVDTLEQTVIPRAEETLRLSRIAFEGGETNFLSLLTIQRTLSQTRLSVLNAIEQASTAAAEIDGLLVNIAN